MHHSVSRYTLFVPLCFGFSSSPASSKNDRRDELVNHGGQGTDAEDPVRVRPKLLQQLTQDHCPTRGANRCIITNCFANETAPSGTSSPALAVSESYW